MDARGIQGEGAYPIRGAVDKGHHGSDRAPERTGSHDRPEIAAAARTYHLRNSRDRVRKSIGRVQRLRHFLLYRTTDDGKVEIGRVLHAGMDLTRHLPREYRAADWDEGGLG